MIARIVASRPGRKRRLRSLVTVAVASSGVVPSAAESSAVRGPSAASWAAAVGVTIAAEASTKASRKTIPSLAEIWVVNDRVEVRKSKPP